MNEIIKQVKEVFAKINDQGKARDSIGLLESANSLSTLRTNLCDYWINAKEESEIREADYKAKIDTCFLKLRSEGKTIEECKAQARLDYAEDYCAYLQKESEKIRLAALRDDLQIKVSILQSFASELRSMRNYQEL